MVFIYCICKGGNDHETCQKRRLGKILLLVIQIKILLLASPFLYRCLTDNIKDRMNDALSYDVEFMPYHVMPFLALALEIYVVISLLVVKRNGRMLDNLNSQLAKMNEVEYMNKKHVALYTKEHNIINKDNLLFFYDYEPPYDEDDLTNRGYTIAVFEDDDEPSLTHTIYTFKRSETANVYFPIPQTVIEEMKKRLPQAVAILENQTGNTHTDGSCRSTLWVKGQEKEITLYWKEHEQSLEYEAVSEINRMISESLEPLYMKTCPGEFCWIKSTIKPEYDEDSDRPV